MAEGVLLLAETFARHPLNNESNLTASEDVLSASKTLVDILNGVGAKSKPSIGLVLRACSFVDVSKARLTLHVNLSQGGRL